jgi:hypothetical protein
LKNSHYIYIFGVVVSIVIVVGGEVFGVAPFVGGRPTSNALVSLLGIRM